MTMVRKHFDKVYKGNVKMGLEMTPGEWLTEPTYKKVLRLKMACHGGVGGLQWDEFITDATFEDVLNADRFVEATNFDGEKILINANNIVEVKQYKVASAVMHSENPRFTKGDYTVSYLLDPNATVELVDAYITK